MKARLDYVEFPATNIGASKAFYAKTCGWTLVDFGPEYAATISGDTDIGLEASADKKPYAIPIIHVDDLEAAFARAQEAGAGNIGAIFSFPGGRRFHCTDPSGIEIAFWQKDPE